MRVFLAAILVAVTSSAFAQAPCCGGYNQLSSYLGQVATRSYIPRGSLASATNRQIMSRSLHFAKQTLTSFQILVPNFSIPDGTGTAVENGNGGVANTFDAATVTASVEYPVGTCTQIKFGGLATLSMTTGTGSALSDAVSVNIPNGAPFFIRMYYVGASGVIWSSGANGASMLGENVDVGAAITDRTVTCDAIPTANPGGGYGTLPPFAIVAQTTRPSVCIFGDSIAAGGGSSTAIPLDVFGSLGIIEQSLTPSYAFISFAIGGMQANSWDTQGFGGSGATAKRIVAYQYCSNLIDEMGINDVGNSRTAAQLETNLSNIYSVWTAHAAAPGSIERTLLTPNTTSSDSFVTTVNQTAAAGESNRVQFNTDVLAKSFYTGNYSDYRSVVATGSNFQAWLNPAVAAFGVGCGSQTFPYTIDGKHPSSCGYRLIAARSGIAVDHLHR